MQPWERNAGNLAAALSLYGRVTREPGLRLITSWVEHPVFNIALLDCPVRDPVNQEETELERRIGLAEAHYRAHNRAWSFWICEHHLGPRTMRRLSRILGAHGMASIGEPPGMEADDLPPPARPLPPLEILPATETRPREDFTTIANQCFHIPLSLAREVYLDPAQWGAPLEILVGYADGRAVTAAAFIEAAGALGIYSVATLPAYRGKGFAEAIMRHGVEQFRQQGVRGPLVLQSTPSGMELYRRLGFRHVTRFFVFSK
ncbi:MAG: GNAT family N-acetyltransferase [Bryobacteraceae bacterium]